MIDNLNIEIIIDQRSFELYKNLKTISINSNVLEGEVTRKGQVFHSFKLEVSSNNLLALDKSLSEVEDVEFYEVEIDLNIQTEVGYIVLLFSDVKDGIIKKYKVNIPMDGNIRRKDIDSVIGFIFLDNRVNDDKQKVVDTIKKEINSVVMEDDVDTFLEFIGNTDFTEKLYDWKNNSEDSIYQSLTIKKHKK